jgi:hypothetical protein
MRKIYKQADRVLSWLGPATDNSDLVFDLFEMLQKRVDNDIETSNTTDLEISSKGSSHNNAYDIEEDVELSENATADWWYWKSRTWAFLEDKGRNNNNLL